MELLKLVEGQIPFLRFTTLEQKNPRL